MQHADETRAEIVTVPAGRGTIALRGPDIRAMLRQMWLNAQTSQNTRLAYEGDVDLWFAFCDLAGVDPLNTYRVFIDEFRNRLLQPDPAGRPHHPKKYAESTAARKLAAVSSFYKFCLQESVPQVPRNPVENAKRPPVANESLTRGLTPDEVDRLIDAAAELGGRDELLVHLLVVTGVRISEATGLTRSALGWSDGYLCMSFVRKGGKPHTVPLPVDLAGPLQQLPAGPDGAVFLRDGRQMSRQVGARVLERCGWAAHIDGCDNPKAPGYRAVGPHMLRHVAATFLLEAGVPLVKVQELLGHADVRTTMRYNRALLRASNSAVHQLAELHQKRRAARSSAAVQA